MSIGAYDGIHLGHQAIFRELKTVSVRLGSPSVVMSFEPLPREYFAKKNPPARLTRFRERYDVLSSLGIDAMFCPKFNHELRSMSAEQFVEDILVGALAVRHVVVGDDFRFAADGAGNIDFLRMAGDNLGFGVTEVPTVDQGTERVSSTAIRAALADGDLKKAARMLGRPYSMSGRVIYGNQLGRTLGYPTANIPVRRLRSPVQGIFAVRVAGLGDHLLDGVASVGTRPTVAGGGKTLLEVFIFDFNRDIYGKFIEVQFVARLRDELKFPDLETLTEQMHLDTRQAQEQLSLHE